MKLYHGTSHRRLNGVLKHGIKPREKGKSNWTVYPSLRDRIYLSTTYPFYFACAHAENVVVFEVDLMELDHDLLYPDEDFIWAGMMHNRSLDKDDKDHLHTGIRKKIEDYKHYWVHSINHFGNCSFTGGINPDLIERYCEVDFRKRNELWMEVMNPTITLANHKFCGEFYRVMIKWFFGDIDVLPQVERAQEHLEMRDDPMFQQAVDFWALQSKLRDGIRVTTTKIFDERT
jgi:hypothetical protein